MKFSSFKSALLFQSDSTIAFCPKQKKQGDGKEERSEEVRQRFSSDSSDFSDIVSHFFVRNFFGTRHELACVQSHTPNGSKVK